MMTIHKGIDPMAPPASADVPSRAPADRTREPLKAFADRGTKIAGADGRSLMSRSAGGKAAQKADLAAMQIEKLLFATLLKEMFKNESAMFGESGESNAGGFWKGFFVEAVAGQAPVSCLGLHEVIRRYIGSARAAEAEIAAAGDGEQAPASSRADEDTQEDSDE